MIQDSSLKRRANAGVYSVQSPYQGESDADLIDRFAGTAKLGDDAAQVFRTLFKTVETYAEGSRLVRVGQPFDKVGLVSAGWLGRSLHARPGRRQIIQIILPGEIILPSLSADSLMTHDIEALTPCRVLYADRQTLTDALIQSAQESEVLATLAQQEIEFLRETVVNLGRQSALERVAYFLLRLHKRLVTAGFTRLGEIHIPITQRDLSDRLGLSLVHYNKTLRRMEQEGWIKREGDTLVILNSEKMRKGSEFSALEKLPRTLF